MSDIVERLRRIARGYEPTDMGVAVNMDDAAYEIARLRAENERMREALTPLARLQIPKRTQGNAGAYSIFHREIEAARAALGDPPTTMEERGR